MDQASVRSIIRHSVRRLREMIVGASLRSVLAIHGQAADGA
jgi:hypothetical protein